MIRAVLCCDRSWNQFGLDINETLLEAQFRVLADRSRLVNGWPTSLLDLGYANAAIDDGWQLCNSGPGGVGFHNASGWPNVNTSRFPSMRAMTAKARSLGLKPGWYENNCHCADHKYGTYEGLVQATLDFVRHRIAALRECWPFVIREWCVVCGMQGFQGIKMDRAGLMNDAQKLSAMFNATGVRVLQENNDAKAHRDQAGNVICPMHFFRTGLDIRPTHGSVLKGIESVLGYNEKELTGPGCWYAVLRSQ